MAFQKKRQTNPAVWEDLETIKEVFESVGVEFRVVYGLLLGMHRDGAPPKEDDDIDLAVVEPINLETRKKIGWLLFDLGFMPQPIAFNVFGRMETAEPGYNGDEDTGIIVCERNFRFTIFFFKQVECEKHGPEFVCHGRLGAQPLISIPAKFFDDYEEIKINKKWYYTPAPIEEFLNFAYYNNWKDDTDKRHSPLYPEQHANS